MSVVLWLIIILAISNFHYANLRRIEMGDPLFSNQITLYKWNMILSWAAFFSIYSIDINNLFFINLSFGSKMAIAFVFLLVLIIYFYKFRIREVNK